MDDYAPVLNAGSSSLMFCVFRRADEKDWQVAGRGQIEGIGTSPRLSAKDAHGVVLANNSLDVTVRDGHAAIDALGSWLRSKWHGARVLDVGHRIVHGGVRYGQPVVMTPQILSDLYELVPLAPLNPSRSLANQHGVLQQLRIRLEISSSNFPRFDRNPNTGTSATRLLCSMACSHCLTWGLAGVVGSDPLR